jgi:TatD DNase family protein
MWVDSHCHLDFPDFEPEREAVIARAKAAGVDAMLTISTHLSRQAQILKIAETHPNVWCSTGLHPHEAGAEPMSGPQTLIENARHPKVIGIGETGLDYYYEHSPRLEQERAFRFHIEAARDTQLPLIVHARDADDDIVRVLKDEARKGSFPGLIHCFTSGPELAAAALELGFMISLSGIVTFKSAQAIRDIVKTIPLDRILVETDAPFLAPLPHRGKRNEPSFVVHTAAVVATLKGVALEELGEATSANFYRLFTKAVAPK